MKAVKIIEWKGRTGPLTRWAGLCFGEAGYEVEVSFDKMNTGGAVDLVFTPIPGLEKLLATPHLSLPPLVTQLEGMGRDTFMPGSKASPKIETTLALSDQVLLVDPNMYTGLRGAGVGDKLDETLMVPNPVPPSGIFVHTYQSKNRPFTVFYPSGAWDIKKPERFVEAARIVGEQEPSIRFVMITGPSTAWRYPLEWLDAKNIEFLPHQPHERMIQLYVEADIVCPWSAAEILPWTVFESFVAGKPTVVDVIGKVQSVNREHVGEMISWFGVSSGVFQERWEDKYATGEGYHYLRAGSSEELANIILELYRDEKRRLELELNARKWINAYDWKPKDKGKKILDLLGIK